MKAVKYKTLILKDTTQFQWLEKIHHGISTLPEGFDEFISQAALDTLVADNQANFDLYKTQQADVVGNLTEVAKFGYLRNSWQKMADELAVENIGKGITVAGKSKEVADAFRDVVYYLNANTPTEAIASLSTITPITTFLEQATIDTLVADFTAIVNDLWGS